MKKKIFSMVILLIIAISLTFIFSGCENFQNETYKYTEIEGGYSLKKFTGVSIVKKVEINEYKGLPVKELQQFSIANSEYLEEIIIGKNVEIISSFAFTNNINLKKFTVSPENPNFCDVDGVLYTKNKDTLLAFPLAKNLEIVGEDKDGKIYKQEYEILSSVKVIGDNAFYKGTKISKLVLPDGLETIGARAFHHNERLVELIIPSTVSSIGQDSVSYCYKLTEMYIPKSVINIGSFAFFGSSEIKEMLVEYSMEEFSSVTVGERWVPYSKIGIGMPIPILYGIQRV